jgi:serine/threonine protein kinase
VFSFGVVLYEMASGFRPFKGESSGAIFDAILHKVPVALVRLNSEIPAELDWIVQKAMEKDRDLRYQSAGDMRADLKRLRRDTTSGRAKSSVLLWKEPRPNEIRPQPLLWVQLTSQVPLRNDQYQDRCCSL